MSEITQAVADAVEASRCQQAFASFTGDARCVRISQAMLYHLRLALIVSNAALHQYEVRVGTTPKNADGSINWQAIIQWFITNGPMIMQMVLAIIALFGA